MYKTNKLEKEVFRFWKSTSPLAAFSSGLKQYAGRIWIPTKENKRKALEQINRLLKKSKNDVVVKKFLQAERLGIRLEEPQDVPGSVMGALYTHFLIEGFVTKHLGSLADDCVALLHAQNHLLRKDWPAEIRILTLLACNGALGTVGVARKNVKNKRVQEKLDALSTALNEWRAHFVIDRIKKGSFDEVYPLLKKKAQGFRREKIYSRVLKTFYDYKESPREIEKKAVGWLEEELPLFKAITAKLAAKLECKTTVNDVEKQVKKKFHVSRTRLIKTIKEVRKVLEPIARQEWVRITPKYDVRIVETPDYLVPFMPTAAMTAFNNLTKKPYCVFFATTDPRGSPSDSLVDLCQTIIHEEYGHCVNFMNSYTGFLHELRLIEVLGSPMDVPITEGLSFHREFESLEYFRHLEHKYERSKAEKKFLKFINKYSDLETFTDALEFVVRKWRLVRFLRAISDSRVNSGKQKYPAFLEWAAKKTGLRKKLIYDQTFFFQENPGYSPNYSVFGQRLRELQAKALSKGVGRVEFNTFVESTGFPPRKVFEKQLKNKFKI